jgi:hypothetical protein
MQTSQNAGERLVDIGGCERRGFNEKQIVLFAKRFGLFSRHLTLMPQITLIT